MPITHSLTSTIARTGLNLSRSSRTQSEQAETRASHLEQILDSVSIFDEEKTGRQVASTVLRASRAANTDKARSWVAYLGLKHLASGLQGPSAVTLSAIGADMMRGGQLMISDDEAVTCGSALMDGISSYSPGIIASAKVEATKEAALRAPELSTQKSVLWSYFEATDNRDAPGGGCG